ncbi:DNA-binding transcriptional regulator; DLP12 prophage [Escherichia coli]|nr:DNA-binding transcriptional regulator; DLP12 prophage [Escherichia coli]
MGVLLSLGVNHVNHLLLSYSKQSLISRCYNLLLSETRHKMDSKQGCSDISTFLFLHYIAV